MSIKDLISLLYVTVASCKACLITRRETRSGFGPLDVPNHRGNFGAHTVADACRVCPHTGTLKRTAIPGRKDLRHFHSIIEAEISSSLLTLVHDLSVIKLPKEQPAAKGFLETSLAVKPFTSSTNASHAKSFPVT